MADLGTCAALKAAIAARIFTNTTFEVSAKDIDDAFIDTIDTLKGQLVAYNETNYGDLITNINGGTLVPGAFYAFDYQSKYVVDFVPGGGSGNSGEILNTDVSTIQELNASFVTEGQTYTVPTEKLIVQAMSVSQLNPRAVSVQNPRDIIIYDALDNTTEENGATSGNRSGFIHYREDPVKNIKTEFDFRAAISYVTRIEESIIDKQYSDHPVLVINNQAPVTGNDIIFSGPQSGQVGTLLGVTLGARSYFRIFGAEQNETSTPPATLKYRNIEIGRADGALTYGAVYGIGRVPNVIICGQQVTDVKIGRDTSHITFFGFTMSSVDIGDRCTNFHSSLSLLNPGQALNAAQLSAASLNYVKVEDGCTNIYMGSGTHVKIGTGVSNMDITSTATRMIVGASTTTVTVIDGVFNLEIGENCQDILSWASSADIGQGCNGVTLIHSGAGPNGQAVIGKNCDDIIAAQCVSLRMGIDNFGVRAYALADFEIGNANEDLFLKDSRAGSIGHRNEMIELVSQSGAVKIGDDNVNLRLEVDSFTIGNNNENIYMTDPITDGVIGDHNTAVLMFQCNDLNLGDRNTNIFMNTCSGINIANGNDRITVTGTSDVTIGSNCSRVTRAHFPLFILPTFSISSAYRGIIWVDTLNAQEMFSGTEYVSLVGLLNVSGQRILGNGNSASGGSNIVVGDNCENIILTGGSEITVGDNVNNFYTGHQIDFTLINELDVTLTGSVNASDYTLSYISSKGGIPTTGGRVTPLDEIAPVTVNTEMAVPGDIGITPNGGGGNGNIVIKPGREEIKLRSVCGGVIVDASTVDLDQISNVEIKASVTIPSSASGPSGAVIDLKSPDGKAWYQEIDNAGVVTRSKYE